MPGKFMQVSIVPFDFRFISNRMIKEAYNHLFRLKYINSPTPIHNTTIQKIR